MHSFFSVLALSLGLLLAGCQSVNTATSSTVGVERKQYMLSSISTEEINASYATMYLETLNEAAGQGALDTSSAQARQLQEIATRLIAQVGHFRPDAVQWDWEVNLIRSDELNANCGPGGKIIFYSGLIEKLQLTDNEIAAVMGHEIAHALREHSREQISRSYGLALAKTGVSTLLGLGQLGSSVLDGAVSVGVTLPNSREAETEADLLGIELAARAGYDPHGAVSLWQKMEQYGGNGPAEFMSTHPAPGNRVKNLEQSIPRVMPFYRQSGS